MTPSIADPSQQLDLVVSTLMGQPGNYSGNFTKNGIIYSPEGQFGQITVLGGYDANLTFTFVRAGGTIVDMIQ